MKIEDMLKRAYAMPLTSPACPPGPYRFVNREFFIVTYRTSAEAVRAAYRSRSKSPLRSSNTSSSGCPIRRASAITPSLAR